MKKLTVVLVLLLTIFFTGCAQKGTQPAPKPQTIVVPEVTSIPFDLVELSDAPAVIKKITMTMEDKEFINVAAHNGKGYIIIVPDTKNEKATIAIDRIEQRIPEKNYPWLNVKLKYSATHDHTNKPVIARFKLDNMPKGVGFQLDRLDLLSTTQAERVRQIKQSPVQGPVEGVETTENEEESIKGPAIRVLEPRPGDGVTSPLTFKGEVGFLSGQVRVRLKNESGKILAEKPVEIKDRKIETSIPFVAPNQQQQGVVEVFLINPSDNTEVSRVSVYVTLLPAKG